MTLYLIPCQNLEGSHDLVGGVCVGCLAGHEVDEGLEGDDAHPVGIHYAHDAGELVLTLEATESDCDTVVTVPNATHSNNTAKEGRRTYKDAILDNLFSSTYYTNNNKLKHAVLD